ncbi:MAG: ABC transporter ATP-binding protein [Bacilli bacterium]|nr:ABC transporter ATP-binding protein [Bacilli bacterium]
MIFGKNVNRYYFKYAHFFILGIIALIFVDIYQLDIPEIIGQLIDGIKEKTITEGLLMQYMKQLLVIVGIMFVGRFLWRVCIFGNGIRIEADLREKMFAHSEKLSQSYYQENKTGALMALYTNDLQTIRQSIASGTIMFIDAALLGFLSFYKMWSIDKWLSIFASIPLLILALCGGIIGKFMRKKFEDRQKSYADLSDFTQENFSGMSVIKAFVKEGKELIAFSKINRDYLDKNISFVKAAILLEVLIGGLISLVIIVIIGYGGYLVFDGTLSIGKLTEYIAYFGTLTWPMMAIAQLINMQSQAKASLKRIDAHLNHPIEIQDGKDILSHHDFRGQIQFNNLTFSYPKSEKPVLENISFTLKAGESLGIIGRTGSGKTTLVDLLLRIYNVPENTILIDDIDIMRLPLRLVRDQIAYVPQDNFLYSDSIRNNIDFAANTQDLSKITEAAVLADVDKNIQEFSQGYDTILGERGVTISGGQKQRVSIARALLKDAKILIMDDSVSAVDTKTEEQILLNLRKVRKNKTTILIAHRITTVQSMDKILVLDEGRVEAFGTHQELLKSSPLYANMVRLQTLEDEVTA